MKGRLIGTALVLLTAGLVVLYPWVEGRALGPRPIPILPAPLAPTLPKNRIEVVFVLDTTSSMTGLIAAAKEKIWSIATTLAQAEGAAEIEMGLVAFRDRGDAYVTEIIDLSSDLDTMYGRLMDFAAVGGGDGPESVNQALADAVHRISWSRDPSSYRVIFLVGDAPPHMDYAGEAQYPAIVREAVARGIVVNTIQCGEVPMTAAHWSAIAQFGGGRYLKVGQNGGAFAVATPYDAELAQLSAELDGTRLFYGSPEQMRLLNGKMAATGRLTAEASEATRARRAAFNATTAGERNLFGDQDLVADVMSGEVRLEEVPADELPASLGAVGVADRLDRIESLAAEREALQTRIEALTASRAAFIEAEAAAAPAAASSLDRQIFETVREQAASKGLRFDGGPEF